MDINKKLVSIAIPAYKSRHLEEAISSVLTQTYNNIELIIVDDASPEDIVSVVRKFSDNRLFYYRNKTNIGGKDPVSNWNKCLSYAKGEYFCLLCDDDKYERTFVEEMMSMTISHPDVDVFRSRVKFIDNNSDCYDLFPSSPEFESAYDYLWNKVSRFRIQTISEFMLKTEVIRNKKGYISTPKAWCADEMSICYFAKEHGICHTNKTLVSFRMSGENITSDKRKNIVEKIEAEKIFTLWVKDFVVNEEIWYKESIFKHRQRSCDITIPGYISNANFYLFFKILCNKSQYCITKKQIAKAIFLKLSNLLRRIWL